MKRYKVLQIIYYETVIEAKDKETARAIADEMPLGNFDTAWKEYNNGDVFKITEKKYKGK